MNLDLWPQVSYLVLLSWGLVIQYRASMQQFKKTLISGAVLCFILYHGGFFDPIFTR